jgi:hypothetical protein
VIAYDPEEPIGWGENFSAIAILESYVGGFLEPRIFRANDWRICVKNPPTLRFYFTSLFHPRVNCPLLEACHTQLGVGARF